MHYLRTENEHKIRKKCIKSKDHERNTTCRPRGSGVQSGVTKSKGLYTRYLCDGAYLRAVFSFKERIEMLPMLYEHKKVYTL